VLRVFYVLTCNDVGNSYICVCTSDFVHFICSCAFMFVHLYIIYITSIKALFWSRNWILYQHLFDLLGEYLTVNIETLVSL
jgi:hypothetical protein